MLIGMSQLRTNMQMTDMLPANQPEVVAYEHAIENFKGIHSIVVAVRGEEQNIRAYITDMHSRIKELEHVEHGMYRNEIDFLKKHGLLLLKTRGIESLSGVLSASSLKEFIAGLNDNFEKEYIAGGDSDKIRKDRTEMLYAFNTIEDFLHLLASEDPQEERVREISDAFLTGPRYMISPDRSMGIMFVQTSLPIVDIERVIELVRNVDALVKEHQEQHSVYAGISGMLVLQRDEMDAATHDMKISFILSLILIIAIFITGFRLFRYTVLAVIPLIIGVIWAMGLTYVFIGSLNTFTAMMGAILIGLGIDYAIHIMALFTEERYKGTPVEEALSLVFAKTAKGIVTGSVTTSIGFLMFVFSSFPGFRDFGVTLGFGILSILAASLVILPILLLIFGKKDVRKPETLSPVMHFFNATVIRHPNIVMLVFLILVVFSAVRFKDIGFTTDLKEIEPKGLESLAINDMLIEKFDFSSDSAIAVSKTLAEAHAIKDDAEDLHTVGTVESIAHYLPEPEEQQKRIAVLKKIRGNTNLDIDKHVHIPGLQEELKRLQDNIIEISDLAYMGGEHKIVDACDALLEKGILENAVEGLKKNASSLQIIQKQFIKNLKEIVIKTQVLKPVTVDDLPKIIKDSYIGRDGTYLTTIYPEGDVWNDEFQPLYLQELDSLKAPLTGTTMLSLQVLNTARVEGKRILLLVVLVIYLVLLVDFRSFKYATLAMIPMALTLVLLIGVMVWCNIPFDFVNIIALPIIIGIGVDDGVHLIHRYKIENKLLPAVQSTGRGILLTTITTMAAFGTLMVSTYQGFMSFGLVLVMGIGWAYILTIFLLSSMLIKIDKING